MIMLDEVRWGGAMLKILLEAMHKFHFQYVTNNMNGDPLLVRPISFGGVIQVDVNFLFKEQTLLFVVVGEHKSITIKTHNSWPSDITTAEQLWALTRRYLIEWLDSDSNWTYVGGGDE